MNIYRGDISCNGYTRIKQISVQKVYNIFVDDHLNKEVYISSLIYIYLLLLFLFYFTTCTIKLIALRKKKKKKKKKKIAFSFFSS